MDASSNGADIAGQTAAYQRNLFGDNQKLSDSLLPYFQQWLSASDNPTGDISAGMTDYENEMKAHGFADPYSSSNSLAMQGDYRDAGQPALQRELATLKGMQIPGSAGNSNIQQQIAMALSSNAQDNANYARQLRIRGGQERYANYQNQRNNLITQRYRNFDALGNDAQMLTNVRGMMSGNIGGLSNAGQQLRQIGQQQFGNVLGLAETAGSLYAGMPKGQPGPTNEEWSAQNLPGNPGYQGRGVSTIRGTGSGLMGTNQNGNTSWSRP